MRTTPETPLEWRRGWKLYRRKTALDSYGDPVTEYDMESPDYEAEGGTAGAVCWQITSDTAMLREYGEDIDAIAEGVLFADVEAENYDRFTIDGVSGLWELRAVTPWLGHKELRGVHMP